VSESLPAKVSTKVVKWFSDKLNFVAARIYYIAREIIHTGQMLFIINPDICWLDRTDVSCHINQWRTICEITCRK
jgi:hypothetical protein